MTYRQPDGTGLCVGTHKYEPERPRHALPDGHLCGGCQDRLRRALADMPNLIDDLERALINGTSGHGPKISGSPTRPLGFNEEAGDARRALLTVLGSWTRLMAEERDEHLPADLSPRGQAQWHGYRLAVWTVAQPWIDEYATNIVEAAAEGRRVLAGTRSRTLILGDCTGHDRCDVVSRAEVRCDGKLRARVDLVDELLPAAVACTGCGQEHAARDLPALGKTLTGGHAWLTTAQVAEAFGISESRVRHLAIEAGWRRRDHETVRPSRWHTDDVSATRAQSA